jgi:oligopeptide/dipeptide ABC transporter ATP-binding protein
MAAVATRERALSVENLTTRLGRRDNRVTAVDGVSFDLEAGRILGIVGESGSGKTTLALSLLRLIAPPGEIVSGSRIVINEQDVMRLSNRDLRHIRGRKVSLVRQNPLASLNPVVSVGDQVMEALIVHRLATGQAARSAAVAALAAAALPNPEQLMKRFPHELSGGMRQRVAIAMAIVASPSLLVADEPTSALDATVEREILQLLRRLCDDRQMAVVLVSHNLAAVAAVADQIAVMYAGRIVEHGAAAEVMTAPLHPYTEALVGLTPTVEMRGRLLTPIPGLPPDMTRLPSGCAFHPRCSFKESLCTTESPSLETVDGRPVACWVRQREERP